MVVVLNARVIEVKREMRPVTATAREKRGRIFSSPLSSNLNAPTNDIHLDLRYFYDSYLLNSTNNAKTTKIFIKYCV